MLIGDFVLNKIINGDEVSLSDLKNEIGWMNDDESLSFYASNILIRARCYCYVFESCSLLKYLGTEFGSDNNGPAAIVQHTKEVMQSAEKVANLVINYNEWKDSV